MSTKTAAPYTNTKTTTYKDNTQRKRFGIIFGAIVGSVALVLSTVAILASQVEVDLPFY